MRPIDAVIPWVDGNDPRHRARLAQYAPEPLRAQEDVAAPTRYASLGEILWCVASLNLYAPYIRKIFIVTDGQDPGLEPFLAAHFPDGYIPFEIVDHKTVFAGFEDLLPVFNSRSVESVLWRIPGLSEHFIALNDDFLLTAPVPASHFFDDAGNPVIYARKRPTAWLRLLRALKPRKDGRKNVSFKESMITAADLLGGSPYILRIEHTPRPLLKSRFQAFFAAHPDLLRANIACRFRSHTQFSPIEIQYLPLYQEGRCALRDPFRYLFYLKPKPKKDYVVRKMARLEGGDYCFCCFNSLDLASDEDRERIRRWVEGRLFPQLRRLARDR